MRHPSSAGALAIAVLLAGVGITAITPAVQAHPPRSPRPVSGDSPYATDCRDATPGETYLGSEVEPSLAVDPRDPDHLAVAWQQDRRSNGAAQGVEAAVTFDGGRSWHRPVNPPAFSQCGGGEYERASDPWIRFGPDGTLYLAALAASPLLGRSAIFVARSVDGGRSWDPARALIRDDDPGVLDDKPSMTPDPRRRGYAYAVWTRLSGGTSETDPSVGPAYFARTTDGGITWEAPRPILNPGPGAQTTGCLVEVLGDGTLVLVTTIIAPDGTASVVALRSTDAGATWEASPQQISPLLSVSVVDPATGARVRTADFLPSAAADPRPGRRQLYVAWQDARLTGGADPQVILSSSHDGGDSWSPPVRMSGASGQAFLPHLAVSQRGVPLLAYFDFSRDQADTAALETTMWTRRQLSPGRWSGARAVESLAIDMRAAPVAGGYFIGDYVGVAALGLGFAAAVPIPRLRPEDWADVVYLRL